VHPLYIENTTILKSTARLLLNSERFQYKILINSSGRPTKFYKEPSELMDTIDQKDLTDIYRVFHPPTAQYILFISPWNVLQNTKYKKLERTPCTQSNHME
jgi:hypothetical protein